MPGRALLWSPSPPGHLPSGPAALDAQLALLETKVYQTLHGIAAECGRIAAQADGLGLEPQAIRARLLASDVHSRDGRAAEARKDQLALHAAAAPWPALAARAAMYLISSCDRIGERIESMQWQRLALRTDGESLSPAWHAEALMVAALMSCTRSGADYTLVDQALAAVRAHCGPLLLSVTAANFAEVATECGQPLRANHYADEAVAALLRHPEAAAALTWESVARARLAAGELAAADHAMRASLDTEERYGCCDVNGDPWLTYADLRLACDDADGALQMLDHPRRLLRLRSSPSTSTRELKVRAKALAMLERWQEAYACMVEYMGSYEQLRSIEGDRAVAESSAAVAMEEERRRAQRFERLALTDPLTGLPNRRHADHWLAQQADAASMVGRDTLCVAIVDLDHFKHINDLHSHDAGDSVLQRVAALLQQDFGADTAACGAPQMAARLGGEEFVLAWCGLTIDAAQDMAEAWCARLRALSFHDIVGDMPVTASIGLACGDRRLPTGQLLRAADECLYDAKRAGRDRVVVRRASLHCV